MSDLTIRLYGSDGKIYKKVYEGCIWKKDADGSIHIIKREENPQYKAWYAAKMEDPLTNRFGYVDPYNDTFVIAYGPHAWHSVE